MVSVDEDELVRERVQSLQAYIRWRMIVVGDNHRRCWRNSLYERHNLIRETEIK